MKFVFNLCVCDTEDKIQLLKRMILLFSLLFLFGPNNQCPPTVGLAMEHSIVKERAKTLFKAKSLAAKTDPDATYASAKADIHELRKNLNERYKKGDISFDQIKIEFTNQLVDKIIPHWYGTPWSFGGHTAVPNQGEIACGYFISTTLRDMGIKLNRYKLAQKSPIDEAKVISCGLTIHSIDQDSDTKAFVNIDRLTTEGLYFIGFDKGHVGYLLKRQGQLFLIHSNYLSPGLVCMEPLEASRVFKSFSKFHIVAISNNDLLLQHWLNSDIIL